MNLTELYLCRYYKMSYVQLQGEKKRPVVYMNGHLVQGVPNGFTRQLARDSWLYTDSTTTRIGGTHP